MSETAGRPRRAGAVLAALVISAGVANISLSLANVALPAIGDAFDASQNQLNLVAVAFTLGLAASVLYLGAVADRYGRKLVLVLGLLACLPTTLLAFAAPSVEVLALARLLGGIAAGAAYPTTLSLIAALWSGGPRTAAIAIWSGAGGALSALGPLAAGIVTDALGWRFIFLVTVPLVLAALALVLWAVPSRVNESTEGVDHLGGILSVLAIGCLVVSIHATADPGALPVVVGTGLAALALVALFAWRQLSAHNPLYDLRVARRSVFWVAAVSGVIAFGSLSGAMYVGQLFLQDVLSYSAVEAGAAILPAAVMLLLMAPVSGRMIGRFGSRTVLLVGLAVSLAGFVVMWLGWTEHSGYLPVGLAYVLIGAGVGIAGPPASRSLTASVPVDRVGMASATSDLQRDLGGAVLQSALGAILTLGYAREIGRLLSSAPAEVQSEITDSIGTQLRSSFSSAQQLATQYPDYADQIVQAARDSFLQGAQWAYAVGVLTMLVGILVVVLWYPRRDHEAALLAEYQRS